MRRSSAKLGLGVLLALVIGCCTAVPAMAAGDNNIPGTPIGPGATSGVVDSTTDPWDVYSVKLFDGEQVRFTLNDGSSSVGYVSVRLVAPGVTSVNDSYTDLVYLNNDSWNMWYDIDETYTPAKDGVYHILVRARSSGANYVLTISGSAQKPPNPAFLRLRTSSTSVTKGRYVTLSARLVDGDSALIPGMTVSVSRSFNGRSWAKIKTLASSTGKYSLRRQINRKTWFRMRYAGNSTWSSCRSRVVTVRLR